MCGEQRLEDTERGCDGGSPPRVRGTGLDLYSPVDVMRITPACAGNSKTCISLRISSRDHPRVCGEQFSKCPAHLWAWGSPPRVRGTDLRSAQNWCAGGITPACAGNRHARFARCGQCQDHPRVCGEQLLSAYENQFIAGSPPRVRGTGHLGWRAWCPFRITPACAGNRALQAHLGGVEGDHPRVCGEQSASGEGTIYPLGSPPRVRGTAFGTARSIPAKRITPACAGNSIYFPP